MSAHLSPASERHDAPSMPIGDPDSTTQDVLQRIGVITRRLHDALSELGYDKTLARAVDRLPDARARLSYIARLTGESAEKVLNTVEFARGIQDEMRAGADALRARWHGQTVQSLAGPHGEALVADTGRFLGSLEASTDQANGYLTEIMMAQDFHDLTGQVVCKVVDLAHTLEEQLVALLVETAPPEFRARVQPPGGEHAPLNGPVIDAEGRTDVVTSQSQVDEMLESLGF